MTSQRMEIPQHLLKSSEWRAALLLLANTTLKEFFNTRYVDLQKEEIDFKAMKRHASTHSQKFLAGLAAHLFNAWQFNMPSDGMFSLDYQNKCYAFLAMMDRHGVHPEDVVRLAQSKGGR